MTYRFLDHAAVRGGVHAGTSVTVIGDGAVGLLGEEGIERVRELTGRDGTHVVLEAVGHRPAYDQAIDVVRPGGAISRVGVPPIRGRIGRLRDALEVLIRP